MEINAMMINRGKPRYGTHTIEMAFVAPVALFLIVGIMDVGLAIASYNNIAEASREGGRYAQIHGSKYAVWYAGLSSPGAGTPPASGPTANDANVDKAVRSYANVDPAKLTVYSSWPNGNNNPNSPVTIDAYYSYSPVLFLGLSTLNLHTKTTFYINY
jgi:Flp pilus assembly protein TadG